MKNIEIVKRAQKGDKEAFVKLINDSKENLYKIAFTYMKNEQEALDVVSDAVYKAYIDIKKVKKPEFFNTWITKILINSAINRLRKGGRIIYIDDYQKNGKTEDDNLEIHFDIPANIDLYNALDNLEIKYRSIIILKYFQDMTIVQISKVLDLPEGTVKVYLRRALKKLKIELKEECM
jgi:RNA polymerase sigma-70 factor (ECF subfamily)